MLKLGVHVKKTGILKKGDTHNSIGDAIRDEIKTHGITAAQIFTHGPAYFKKNNITKEDFKDIKIDLTVHCCYSSTSFWKEPEKKDIQLANMLTQADLCKEIGAWGCVIHIYKTPIDAICKRANLLKDHFIKNKITLLLEMSAGVPSDDNYDTYDSPERINALVEALFKESKNEDWFGITVDTAHIWGAGQNIATYEAMFKWLQKIKYPKQIKQFHLNGSKAECRSGIDKHAAPFEKNDKIWHGTEFKNSGVRAVLEFAKKYDITIICEINDGDLDEVVDCFKKVQQTVI